LTVVIESLPRRKGRGLDPSTSTATVPVSPLPQLGQRAHAAVAVAVGEAAQDVADGDQARFRGGLGELRADSLERLDRGAEHARPRPVHRRLAQLGGTERGPARESARRRYWAASSHHQLG
jgi:hypothetical protein